MAYYKLVPLKKDEVGDGDLCAQLGFGTLVSASPSTVNVATNLTLLEASLVQNHTTQANVLKSSQQPSSGNVTVTGPNSVTDIFSILLLGRVN